MVMVVGCRLPKARTGSAQEVGARPANASAGQEETATAVKGRRGSWMEDVSWLNDGWIMVK